MKKIIIMILLSTVLCMTLTVSAGSVSVYAIRMCPYCHQYGAATVTCDRNSKNLSPAPDAVCSLHSPCTITDRKQSTSSYTCSNVNCIAYYNSLYYDTHIESVYHTFTRTTSNVCNY